MLHCILQWRVGLPRKSCKKGHIVYHCAAAYIFVSDDDTIGGAQLFDLSNNSNFFLFFSIFHIIISKCNVRQENMQNFK